MPRYIVERTFPQGLRIPITEEGANSCRAVIANNAEESVTWVTSFVSLDLTKTYCIYDGPSVASIERAAVANGLPVDSVSEVRVLDPYFYVSDAAVEVAAAAAGS